VTPNWKEDIMKPITGWWNRRRACLRMLVPGFVVGFSCSVRGQCDDPPCPSGCPTTCDVTTQAELQAALDCHATVGNYCSHIRIPANTTLQINSQVTIETLGSLSHSGLHLEIIGAIMYTGTASQSARIFQLKNVEDVTFDGNGTITSNSDWTQASGGIAKVFGVTDDCSEITIQNLTITNLGSVMEVDTGVAVSDLTVTNVHANGLVNYGYFVSEKTDGLFRNCSVVNTRDQHGFRLYVSDAMAGGDLDVENCWAYHNREDKTGIWILEGDDARVDRFSSNRQILFGPDSEQSSPPPLTNLFARELRSSQEVMVDMGVDYACLVNLCTPVFYRGRPAGEAEHDLPLDHTNWDEVSGSVPTLPTNPLIICGSPHPVCRVKPIDFNYCFADIDRSNAVDVDDLVAVILGWGNCAGPPSGFSSTTRLPCAADIVPHICGNDAVDVDDLIAVILSWGECQAPAEPCGSYVHGETEADEDVPQTVQDCYDDCIEKHPQGGAAFIECYTGCIQALDVLP
jgi:hypothetical protein